MKSLLVLLFFSTAAQAAIVGYVQSPDGSRIEIHDEAGMCRGEALRAEYVSKEGERLPGCWTMRGPVVGVVFLDGDVATIPQQAFRKPGNA